MNSGEYVSCAVIPAHTLAAVRYELRIHAGIFSVRMCTPPEGLRMVFSVEATGRVNRAYVSDIVHGKLAIAIPWTTKKEVYAD